MIDMLTRHAIQVLRQAGHEQQDVATLVGVGVRTVRRVDGEPDVHHIDDSRERERRVCWPARPQQKGSIENLVGWVTGSFFKQRRFVDDADLQTQLAEWHLEVNTQPAVACDGCDSGRPHG